METFDQIIKTARRSKHLTQQQLAEKMELTNAYIAKLEKGGNCPSSSVIEKLSDELDIPIITAYLSAQIEGKMTERIRNALLDIRRERELYENEPEFNRLIKNLCCLKEEERTRIVEIVENIINLKVDHEYRGEST